MLVERNLAESRQKAQALILAGQVFVNGQRADKVGSQFQINAEIEVRGSINPYVSRGGLKLEAGLDYFQIDLKGFTCIDFGASTGGFTDCLLQRGAAKVWAIDVGYGQLAWKLRQDERVVAMERTNARHLTPGDFPALFDLAVIDASFISLEILLEPAKRLLDKHGMIIALVKPQFEVGKGLVGKGGVVRDEELRNEMVRKIETFGQTIGLACKGSIPSPIQGPKGNQEYLVCFTLT